MLCINALIIRIKKKIGYFIKLYRNDFKSKHNRPFCAGYNLLYNDHRLYA